MTAEAPHLPVMLDEAVEGLAVRPDGLYVDATHGAGGHSRAILERLAGGRLIALDVDPTVEPVPAPGLTFARANFRALRETLEALDVARVDGVLFDFGVSSMQFDRPERGFSLRHEAPLDMRMDQSRGRTALEILEDRSERELADLIAAYGEERGARRIARLLVRLRDRKALPRTTTELASAVAGALYKPGVRERIHPATRTFQALRIAVNEELDAVDEGLDAALDAVVPGGRVVAISFHSLEDRIVKRRFRDDPRARALTRRPVDPSDAEVARNPRARSARLRVAERTDA